MVGVHSKITVIKVYGHTCSSETSSSFICINTSSYNWRILLLFLYWFVIYLLKFIKRNMAYCHTVSNNNNNNLMSVISTMGHESLHSKCVCITTIIKRKRGSVCVCVCV